MWLNAISSSPPLSNGGWKVQPSNHIVGSPGHQTPPPPPPPPAKRGSLWITKATTITKKFQGFWNTVAGTQNKADTFFIVSHSLCHALSWNIRLKEDLERSNCPSFCLQVSLYFNHWRQLIIIFRKKWQQQNYTGWQSLQSVHVAGHFQIPRETQQWGLATFLL